jgi:cell division protease FtsH
VATLGGIAAETLVLGEASTGGEQDLEHATTLARDMVTKYGMADEVGPVRLQVKAGEGFLGDDTALIGLSPETQRDVEDAVRRLITEAQGEATAILQAHRRELDTLATRLDAEETLEDEVLQQALAPLLEAIHSSRATEPKTTAPARRTPVKSSSVNGSGRAKARTAAKP